MKEVKILEVEKEVLKRIDMICRFACCKYTIKQGRIINIKGSNIAYVSPHIITIKENNYLIFNGSDKIFINDLDDYIFNYKELEKEYNHSQKVIDNLEEGCEKLDQANNTLIDFIKHILEILKDFFRRILLSKNENAKNKAINILKECYEKDFYKPSDLIEISKDTDKGMVINGFIKEETLEKEYDYFD